MSAEPEEDWTLADWNLVAQTIIKQQQQMIDAINKAAGATSERLMIIKAINEMTEATKLLCSDLEHARSRLDVAVTRLSSSITSMVSVPIAIALVVAASMFFYFKYISETTWLILLAVSLFRYLGDSITAIAKLFGLGRRNGNGNNKP